MTDGTTVRGETVISMSVSNTTISQVKSGDAINITKTCTAFINESGRNYEGGVYWGYTYAVQAWYIGYVLINHSTDAGSGWNTDWDGKLNDWTPPNPYVTGSIRGDFWKGNFGNTLWKRHRIQWGLSNTGTCSAQGFISS